MTFEVKDFEIFKKLKLDIQPVGIKYHTRTPEGIDRCVRKMALCEMLKTAQNGEVFYADVDSHTCEAGPYILGQKDAAEKLLNGEYGAGLEAFKNTGAAAHVYGYIPKMEKGSVNYLAFAPIDKLLYEPDVLIVLADINQTWILMRALTYETGEMWRSSYSTVMGCSWIFVFPHLEREVNYISSGLGFGMKRRKLFPENRHFVCIPLSKLQPIIRALHEMPWTPKAFAPEGQEYVRQLREKLGLEG